MLPVRSVFCVYIRFCFQDVTLHTRCLQYCSDILLRKHHAIQNRECVRLLLKSLVCGPNYYSRMDYAYEPLCEKTGLRDFRPGPTKTGLCSHRGWLEAWNFGFRKERKCTTKVAKTKALISFAATAKLICVFVFAYAKIRFSHVAAHIISFVEILF